MIDDPFLTTDEVLAYLNLNLKTVYRLIKAGRLPAVRVGRQWRFRKSDIDRWLAEGRPPANANAESQARASVLVVDDEESVRSVIAMTLSTAPAAYDVVMAASGSIAIEMLRARTFDLLITDLKMPQMDGLAVIQEARRIAPTMPAIIITAMPSEASAIEAINLGVSGYLTKPFQVQQVLAVVAKALGSQNRDPSR